MLVVAEAVHGLLNMAVFVFFFGLVIPVNTTVGLSTTVPIGIRSLLYIFVTLASIRNPMSPYQNSFFRLIWYLIQKLRSWRYKDRGSDGVLEFANSNIALAKMQLAMEETEDAWGESNGLFDG